MSQPAQIAPQPSGSNRPGMPQRSAAAVGNVPFTFVRLSAILTLIPGSRTVGMVFLVVLAIPALDVWIRARKLHDGSRGLTTSTLIIVCGAFILGAALTPSPKPSATTAEAVPAAPVEQAAVSQHLVVVPPASLVVPVPQPLQTPPPAAPAPRVVPAPVPQTPAGSAIYYKNCAATRAAGAAPIQKGEPGYRSALDRDRDGTACDT
jgi:hypothetical protein